MGAVATWFLQNAGSLMALLLAYGSFALLCSHARQRARCADLYHALCNAQASLYTLQGRLLTLPRGLREYVFSHQHSLQVQGDAARAMEGGGVQPVPTARELLNAERVIVVLLKREGGDVTISPEEIEAADPCGLFLDQDPETGEWRITDLLGTPPF